MKRNYLFIWMLLLVGVVEAASGSSAGVMSLYFNNHLFVDFLIFLGFFIIVTQSVFKDTFGGGLPIALGLILSISIGGYFYKTGLALGDFGPIALLIVSLIVLVMIVNKLKDYSFWVIILSAVGVIGLMLVGLKMNILPDSVNNLLKSVIVIVCIILVLLSVYKIIKLRHDNRDVAAKKKADVADAADAAAVAAAAAKKADVADAADAAEAGDEAAVEAGFAVKEVRQKMNLINYTSNSNNPVNSNKLKKDVILLEGKIKELEVNSDEKKRLIVLLQVILGKKYKFIINKLTNEVDKFVEGYGKKYSVVLYQEQSDFDFLNKEATEEAKVLHEKMDELKDLGLLSGENVNTVLAVAEEVHKKINLVDLYRAIAVNYIGLVVKITELSHNLSHYEDYETLKNYVKVLEEEIQELGVQQSEKDRLNAFLQNISDMKYNSMIQKLTKKVDDFIGSSAGRYGVVEGRDSDSLTRNKAEAEVLREKIDKLRNLRIKFGENAAAAWVLLGRFIKEKAESGPRSSFQRPKEVSAETPVEGKKNLKVVLTKIKKIFTKS